MKAISIRQLSQSFNNKRNFVLKDLNLDIPRGKITIIIGLSGSGKSVLLKHIIGLLKPSSGSIKIFDKNIWDLSLEERRKFRRNFGVLFQNGALFDDFTVLENVCFPLKEYNRNLSKKWITEQAIEKLVSLNFSEIHYGKYPEELSGGMKKRVALARALILDPEILFYDEPTTGLDPILSEMVNKLVLATHNHKKDTTSVVISHDLFAALSMGHHIAMLDGGKVIFSGTPEEFRKSKIEIVQAFIKKGLKKE